MNNIISEIKVSNNIVLLCHNNPDGDAVGSTIAMYILLKRLGKEVDIVIDNPPKRFNFIPEYNNIKLKSNKKYDTAIVLDTGSIERVNNLIPRIVIMAIPETLEYLHKGRLC